MRRIIELSHTEACRVFLKEESYCNFDLPKYFIFHDIINQLSIHLKGRRLSDLLSSYTDENGKTKSYYPCDFENVNFTFLNNKDGKFAWRPLQLIHPALYVSLVHEITEEKNWNLIIAKFKQFAGNPRIQCHSIPIESDGEQSDNATTIRHWWQTIEQQSIELALLYDYVLHTDITDCYGSIYTHTVSWALHTKETAKANRKGNGFIGNVVDKHLQAMSFGQTNGIPQGSVLMDFVAEMVLGFADFELSERIQQADIKDYQILRYRDDYRIFSNNPQDAEIIAKLLTEILLELGLRLNAQKTLLSNNVVKDSIKPDKLYWMGSKKSTKSIQEQLLIVHNLSEKFSNSGSLNKALSKFLERVKGVNETIQNIGVLSSILVDIMYKNPRTYPISSAILSKLLSLLDNTEQRENILRAVEVKFSKIPNTGHIQIWLQRLTIKLDRLRYYEEYLCQKVNDPTIQIWNSDWLSEPLKTLIKMTPIIDEQIIKEIDVVIDSKEVQLFRCGYDYDEMPEG